jgi:hypothetical protein
VQTEKPDTADYPGMSHVFEISGIVSLDRPNPANREYSRLSCGGEDTQPFARIIAPNAQFHL